jgi:hypothetical protein
MKPRHSAEPDAHVIARHLQTGLRCLLVGFVVATVVSLLIFRDVAYLAAIPIPVMLLVLSVVRAFERRSRISALRKSGQDTISDEEIKIDEQAASLSTALKILGTLAVTALVLAAIAFEWRMAGIMAAAIFVYLIFLGFPYWLAAILDAAEDEHEKLTGETRTSR